MIDAGQVISFAHFNDGVKVNNNDCGYGNGNDNTDGIHAGDNDQVEEGVEVEAPDVVDDDDDDDNDNFDDFDQVEEGVEVEAPGPAMRPGDGYTWSRQVVISSLS